MLFKFRRDGADLRTNDMPTETNYYWYIFGRKFKQIHVNCSEFLHLCSSFEFCQFLFFSLLFNYCYLLHIGCYSCDKSKQFKNVSVFETLAPTTPRPPKKKAPYLFWALCMCTLVALFLLNSHFLLIATKVHISHSRLIDLMRVRDRSFSLTHALMLLPSFFLAFFLVFFFPFSRFSVRCIFLSIERRAW